MRAARLLVPILTFAALVPITRLAGRQPAAGLQILWQFEAGG
jgi:hypothetical protein